MSSLEDEFPWKMSIMDVAHLLTIRDCMDVFEWMVRQGMSDRKLMVELGRTQNCRPTKRERHGPFLLGDVSPLKTAAPKNTGSPKTPKRGVGLGPSAFRDLDPVPDRLSDS